MTKPGQSGVKRGRSDSVMRMAVSFPGVSDTRSDAPRFCHRCPSLLLLHSEAMAADEGPFKSLIFGLSRTFFVMDFRFL